MEEISLQKWQHHLQRLLYCFVSWIIMMVRSLIEKIEIKLIFNFEYLGPEKPLIMCMRAEWIFENLTLYGDPLLYHESVPAAEPYYK